MSRLVLLFAGCLLAFISGTVSSQQLDDSFPADRRNRRDTLCHDMADGKQRCTSVQCDPKYGWCSHCSYEMPVHPAAGEATEAPEHGKEVPNPAMNCVWVRITENGAQSAAMNPTAIVLSFLATISLLLATLF